MELLNNDTFHIARRFAQAGQSYDEHAIIQKKIAIQLMQLMTQYLPEQAIKRTFEIGCGSGNLSKIFMQQMQYQTLYLNDLYAEVQQHFQQLFESNQDNQQIQWCIGDVEQLPFPEALDLIMSSSALQWMQDLDNVLNKSAQVIHQDGWLCFSTFGKQNLTEIKTLTSQGLDYFNIEELRSKLEKQGFEVVHISEYVDQLYFKHPKHILQHLKATGVTATASKFRWSKQSLDAFYQGYRQFIGTDEHENLVYPLSYHPIFVIARRV